MPDEEIIVVNNEETPVESDTPTYTPRGVSFDGKHSYTDFGLYLAKRPDRGSPKAKLNLVDVPGMDGYLDFTEANAGEVKFGNRTMVFTFAAMVAVDDQADFMEAISNALHGRRIEQIVLDEDPGWYYTGRASVVFTDIYSWKLRCVVTVDADPYALKLEETVVDLIPSNVEYELQKVERAINNSKLAWNSNFELGTKALPDGIATYGFQQFLLKWPQTAQHISAPSIYVNSADGNTYTSRILTPFSTGEVYVAFSSLTAANVDPAKVYRITVSGIGDCRLYTEFMAAHTRVQNGRKTVVPMFDLDADDDISVFVDGVEYAVPVGRSQNVDIVLKSGYLDVYVPDDFEQSIRSFTMTFREGKL